MDIGSAKLVVLESSSLMGGVEHSTYNLMRMLNRDRWDPLLLCPEEGPLIDLIRGVGIAVQIVPLPRMKSTSMWTSGIGRVPNPLAWLYNGIVLLIAAQRIATVLKRNVYSVLLTKGMQSHFIGGLAAWYIGIPCVWHMQDLLSERIFGINVLFTSLFGKIFASVIIADGEAIKLQYPAVLQRRTFVVLNGVDTEIFVPGTAPFIRHSFGIPEDACVIGHVARITPWKGQMQSLLAFLQIADTYSYLHLIFVGSALFDSDAYLTKLQQVAVASGYEERIHFAGYRTDLPDMLRAMDIAAYSSLEKDTSPLALLSAMSTGLAIVGFNIEGVREVLKHEREGILVPVGDVSALARALGYLARDRTKRKTLASAARDTAQERFDISRFVADCEVVLNSVI